MMLKSFRAIIVFMVGICVSVGPVNAQGERFERRPLPSPRSIVVGEAAGNADTLEEALRSVGGRGEVVVRPKTIGSKLHHFEETIYVDRHLSIFGDGPSKVAITTNDKCFVVRGGVELRLINIQIVAQGFGNAPCIVIEAGTVTLDNVEIRMGGDRTASAIEVQKGGFLRAPYGDAEADTAESGTPTVYQNFIRGASRGAAGVVVHKDASLIFSQPTKIEGFTKALDLMGSAEMFQVALSGSATAVSLHGGAYLEASDSHFMSRFSNAIEISGNNEAALEQVHVGGNVLFNSGSAGSFTAFNNTEFRGSIVTEGDVSSDITLEQSRLFAGGGFDAKGNYQADNGIELGQNFAGTLKINEMLIDGANYGISLPGTLKVNAVFIQELSFSNSYKAGVRLDDNVAPSAIRKIEITSSQGEQIKRPVVISKDSALCQSKDELQNRVFVRWIRSKLPRRVCVKPKDL